MGVIQGAPDTQHTPPHWIRQAIQIFEGPAKALFIFSYLFIISEDSIIS